MQTIALDPRYHERKTREFVTGGDSGELVLHSRVSRGPHCALLDCSIAVCREIQMLKEQDTVTVCQAHCSWTNAFLKVPGA